MSWGFRLDIPANARGRNIDDARLYDGRIVTAGKDVVALRREQKDPIWMKSRYGLMMHFGQSSRLFWNAKQESLTKNERWARLIRQRVLIPVSAHVQSSPEKTWHLGDRAWVPGLVDHGYDGGIVSINGPEGSPILLQQDAAIAWLDANHWDALSRLNGERVEFTLADAFEHAALDREASTRVPIAA